MKTIIVYLALLLFGFQSFSQAPAVDSKEYYLQKSKSQKKTAWILLVGGTAMLVVGSIGFAENFDISLDKSSSKEDDLRADIFGYVLTTGFIADIVSIPLFIKAGRNAKKAATVSVVSQRLYLPRGNSSYAKVHPAIGVKISF